MYNISGREQNGPDESEMADVVGAFKQKPVPSGEQGRGMWALAGKRTWQRRCQNRSAKGAFGRNEEKGRMLRS